MKKRADNVQKLINRLHVNVDTLLQEHLDECESPIEELLCIGLMSELGMLNENKENQVVDSAVFFDVQCEIDSSRNYRADFVLAVYDGIFYDERPICDWEVKLIVECDGWEYHSSKDSISYDNDRDLRILGDVSIPTIRFLGKDINENPLKCARRAIEVLQEMAREKRSDVESIIKSTLECADKQGIESLRWRYANE